ncbi:hypothetical protein [Arthrobacter sp.]|uniref:SMP-30/gluconolactonase/LRE family protein n=1 Tax=Arthrobacter sp. TaxID=1667 RepID=UPI002810EBF4|nr:hypothetical protein [Arthrobacter sp.]
MHTKARKSTSFRSAAAMIAAVAALLLTAPATLAAPQASKGGSVIDLPEASGAEGIAAGKGTTFFAGDLVTGDIYRGDIRTGTAEEFITAPAGRAAAGMKVDVKNDLLFVAGGGTGQAYVYDLRTGDTVATYQLVPAGTGFINDVTLTHDGAWFTNSAEGSLYFVPVSNKGVLGTQEVLPLSGPAANNTFGFNLNGITSVRGGQTLIVAHSGLGTLFTVDPEAGGSAPIMVADPTGNPVVLTNVDGIIAQGNTIWAVQNFLNQVSRIQLDATLSSGVVEEVITSPHFVIPTTAALFGGTLALPNAKFTMGATEFEVVLVDARS